MAKQEHPKPTLGADDPVGWYECRNIRQPAGVAELRRQLGECIADLENIVCVGEPDDGVILLSGESPCYWDEERKIQVYEHEHFSPLGDALIALHGKLSALAAAEPGTREGEGE